MKKLLVGTKIKLVPDVYAFTNSIVYPAGTLGTIVAVGADAEFSFYNVKFEGMDLQDAFPLQILEEEIVQ